MAVDLGFMFIGAIFAVIVVVAIVVVAFVVTRTHSPSPVTFPGMRETPLQLLDRRLAAGEISAEDYKKARDLLTPGAPT